MADPYGIIVKPLANFKDMLALCPAFQLWCEETEPAIPDTEPTRSAACLDYIHLIAYKKPSGGFVYPIAIIDLPEAADYATVATSADGMDFNNGSGIFDVTFFRYVPEALIDDDAAAWIEFTGEIDDMDVKTGLGAIIENIKALSGSGEYLWIREVMLQEGPWWLSEERKASTQRAIMGAKLRLTWGFA